MRLDRPTRQRIDLKSFSKTFQITQCNTAQFHIANACTALKPKRPKKKPASLKLQLRNCIFVVFFFCNKMEIRQVHP